MLDHIKQSESALVAVIRSATQALDAVGNDDVSAALREFEEAKRNALARLKSQADAVRSSLEWLNADALDVAKQLAADLAAPASSTSTSKAEAKAEQPKEQAPAEVEPQIAAEVPVEPPASVIVQDEEQQVGAPAPVVVPVELSADVIVSDPTPEAGEQVVAVAACDKVEQPEPAWQQVEAPAVTVAACQPVEMTQEQKEQASAIQEAEQQAPAPRQRRRRKATGGA